MKKSSFLNALATVAYCFCAVIFIVWVAIIVAFCLGYYTPKTVYAEDIIIDASENPQIQYVGTQPVLRINGIYESDNSNILVDATLVISGKVTEKTDDDGNVIEQDPITETKIFLYSTNEDVITVPEEGNLNEPITITVTKDENGVNKGGFCFINVKNEQGLFMKTPLCVFVDIPVTELQVESSDMQVEIEDETEKFVLYESESGSVTTNFLPANSQDPTHIDKNSAFNAYRKDPKAVEYYIDSSSPQNVISITQNGHITALGVGEALVWARSVKTYDDLDFINNYEPEQPEDAGYIPPELLEGRYVYTSFVVKVKEVTLDEICVKESTIKLELFKTKSFSVEELGISLKASNGSSTYFSSLLSSIVLSTEYRELKLEKDVATGKWNFTILQDPSKGMSVDVTLPNTALSAELTLFEVSQDFVQGLNFEGTGKTDSSSTYNNQVLKTIVKKNDVISSVDTSWNWSDSVEIVPENGKTTTSYFEVKVFAVGVYHNSTEYKNGTFTNEQGEEIISLGSVNFEGFGREVRGEDLKNPKVVQALARGTIVLRACVIKTDIDGNPVDLDGNVINFDKDGNVVDEAGAIKTTNLPTFFEVARSEDVVFRVIEQLTELAGYIEGITEEGSTDDKLVIGDRYIAVSSVSSLTIKLEANSRGALFDAFNSTTESGSWLRTNSSNGNITSSRLRQETDAGENQAYYLDVDFRNDRPTAEYITQYVQVDYYTGTHLNADGYETVANYKFYVIEVPVEKIEINTNITPTSYSASGDRVYQLSGLVLHSEEVKDGKKEVSSISIDWGILDNGGNLKEFELLAPTITAGEIQVLKGKEKGKDYIVPKELVVTNVGYTQAVPDEMSTYAQVKDVSQEGSEKVGEIEIKELGQEFRIVATSSYRQFGQTDAESISDTIYVSGTLAGAGATQLMWNTNDEATEEEDKYTISVSSALLNSSNGEGGFDLRKQNIFGLKLVGSGTSSQDVYISKDSKFISYEIPNESAVFVTKTSDDRLIYAGTAFDTSKSIDIYVVLTTENNLRIKQKYTINFVIN